MNEKNTQYTNVSVSKPKLSIVEIRGEITAQCLEEHKAKAVARMKRDFEMPGFRKGKVPEHILEKNINEKHLLEDAAYSALEDVYPNIIHEHNIPVFTRPFISITKLAFGSPVEFSISVGIIPEFKLPNYKKIAEMIIKKETQEGVTDKDVEDVIKRIQIMRAPLKKKEKESDPDETETPELTDEFVKTLGQFENVDDFRKKIRENIAMEKEFEFKRRRRESIAKELVEKTDMTIPAILLDEEIERVQEEINAEATKYGISKEEYYGKIGKTEEDFLKNQRMNAENQYKMKLILKKIAETENIRPSEKEIESECTHIEKHYGSAHPDRIRAYAEEMLTNEKTLQFLEKSA